MMKPTLLILAAGVGSRYGGLKQLDKIGPSGETIIDYSIYDAIQAGFGRVVFIIKESIEKDFKEVFIEKLWEKIDIDYVFQETWMVPEGILITDERQKPWGTGHAVMMAEKKIPGPFAVINADDFYGREAFHAIADYYKELTPARENDYCMVGYMLSNTLSEFGAVSRGVCRISKQSELLEVTEHTHIEKKGPRIVFKDEKGVSHDISGDTVVSMNFWGFTPSFFSQLNAGFAAFIQNNAENPKAEFYIPSMVNQLIQAGESKVKVLNCQGKWFGMTYKEDRLFVIQGIRELIKQKVYPENLWGRSNF